SGAIFEDYPALGGKPGADFSIPGHGGRRGDPDKMVAAAAFHDGFDPRRHTLLTDYQVEPDASAASYFWAAAAITAGNVGVANLGMQSLQGDVWLCEV